MNLVSRNEALFIGYLESQNVKLVPIFFRNQNLIAELRLFLSKGLGLRKHFLTDFNIELQWSIFYAIKSEEINV